MLDQPFLQLHAKFQLHTSGPTFLRDFLRDHFFYIRFVYIQDTGFVGSNRVTKSLYKFGGIRVKPMFFFERLKAILGQISIMNMGSNS